MKKKKEEMSEYDKQAENFLKKTGTEFKAEFLRYDKYFEDDKVARDIYQITLTRGERKYSFAVGQSITCSGEYIVYPDRLRLSKSEAKKYLKNEYGNYTNFKANTDKNEEYEIPDAYTVLAALTKYDPGTLEDFCSEFGYSSDSRKAEKTYHEVVEEYKQLCMLFNEEEMEMLREIN